MKFSIPNSVFLIDLFLPPMRIGLDHYLTAPPNFFSNGTEGYDQMWHRSRSCVTDPRDRYRDFRSYHSPVCMLR